MPARGVNFIANYPHHPMWPNGCLVLIFVFLIVPAHLGNSQDYSTLRQAMVEEQPKARGIKSEAVLAAMSKVERHRFVPKKIRLRPTTIPLCPSVRGKPFRNPTL
jgi:hypothetical protein